MSRPYWWFKGASVTELCDRLNDTPNARLEVRIDDNQKMTLTVVPDGPSTAAAPFDPPINESHVCPPICP
jgi:hypothetical protein